MKDSDRAKNTERTGLKVNRRDPAEGGCSRGRRGRGRLTHCLLAQRACGRHTADPDLARLRREGRDPGVRGHARRQGRIQDLYRRRADAPILQPDAARNLRQCPGGRRICPKTCGYRCDRALQSGRNHRARQLPPEIQQHVPGAGRRRDGLGHAHALQLLRHLLQLGPHELRGERRLEIRSSCPSSTARSASSTGICRTWAMPASRFIPTRRTPTT